MLFDPDFRIANSRPDTVAPAFTTGDKRRRALVADDLAGPVFVHAASPAFRSVARHNGAGQTHPVASVHCHPSRHKSWQALSCESASNTRSVWQAAQATHRNESFILASKSIGALKRNVLRPLFQILRARGIPYNYVRSDEHYVEIGSNTFFCFGANNESSQDVLQGLTAAGALLDEAALFPQSFVEQAIGRCSVAGAKIWMNCNPEGPSHYLKTDYIDQADAKRILRLQFTLDDNLALAPETKERYKRLFHGLWFKRFILGLWVLAEGAIYDAWDESVHVISSLPADARIRRYFVGVDYGTGNPTCFLLIGQADGGRWYVLREYYYDGRKAQRAKADEQYVDDLAAFLTPDSTLPAVPLEVIFADPSAASFIVAAQRKRLPIVSANNAVLDGIRCVGGLMANRQLFVLRGCRNLIRTIPGYVWDPKAQARGEDAPLKAGAEDHPEDALRYGIYSMLASSNYASVASAGSARPTW